MSLLKGLAGMGALVIEAALSTNAGTSLFRFLCGKTTRGHSYSLAVMEGEDMFVMDPLTNCIRCDEPMSDAAYERVVEQYLASRQNSEVWD